MKTKIIALTVVLTLAAVLLAQTDSYRGGIPLIPSTGGPNHPANKAYQNLDHVIDVRDYGAVVGTGDDITAVQAALDDANDAGGGRVYFPTGDYEVSDSVIVGPNTVIEGAHDATITITSNNPIFKVLGTEAAHISNITIRGLKLVGSTAAYNNKAVDMRWVDNLTVEDCWAHDIKLAFIGELDAETFADVDLANIQSRIVIRHNRYTSSKDEGAQPIVFVRYAKDVDISHNVCVGHTSGLGGGIEVFGGDANPASDGTLAADRKAINVTIVGNTLRQFVSGLMIAQGRNGQITGNVLDDCGEALWVGASFDVTCSGNTITTDDTALQTQGINRSILFSGNTVRTTANSKAFYIGSEWHSKDNYGPISFIGNAIFASVENQASTYHVGHLVIRGNVFHNVTYAHMEDTARLEIENNTWTYDVALGANPLLRLSEWNCDFSGLGDADQVYTSIRGNRWVDTLTAWTGNSPIYIYDPNQTSTLHFEHNTIDTNDTNYNISLATTSASVACTTVCQYNKFGGKVDWKSNNSATTSHVVWRDNYDLDGNDYYGAAPAAGATDYYSVGSRVWVATPAAGGYMGLICTAEGAPGTWTPFGPIQSANAYTTSNVVTTRTLDANGGDIAVVSDVLCSLIEDLKTAGVLKSP